MENIKEKLSTILKNEYYIKYQPVILPAVTGIICLILLLFVVIPQFTKIQTNQKNLKQIQEKIKFYNQKAATLKNIEPKAYEDNLTATLLALPDDRDIPGIIGQIQTLLLQTDLLLDGVIFTNPSVAGSGVNNYQVKIEVTGELENIKSFISKMQESSRLVRLSQIELSSFGLTATKVKASMEFTTFFQSLPQTVINLDKEVPELSNNDKQLLAKLKGSITNTPSGGTIQSPPISVIVGKTDPFK